MGLSSGLGVGSWFKDDVIDPVSDFVSENKEDLATTAAILNPALLLANADVAAGGAGAAEAYQAGEDAKAAADRAAAAERASTAEAVRVMAAENERTEALARARAAASGLGGASSEIYVSALEETGRADIDWLKEVGVSRAQARLDEGTAAFHQARSQMWGSLGSMVPGVGSAMKLFI